MIIDDPIDRFQSNWGIQPTSIALMNDWTTPMGATNIELAGKDWSTQGDFGDGLQGVNEAIHMPSSNIGGIGDIGNVGDIEDSLHSFFDIGSLFVWPIALYGIYAVGKALTVSEPAKKRRSAIQKAKGDLREAKQMSRWRD